MGASPANGRAITHLLRGRAGAPGTARGNAQAVGQELHPQTLPRHRALVRLAPGTLRARADAGSADPLVRQWEGYFTRRSEMGYRKPTPSLALTPAIMAITSQ